VIRKILPALALTALVAACARDTEVAAIFTNINGDAELFPCDPSRDMWRVKDTGLDAEFRRQGAGRLYVRLTGTKVDSGSVYGSRHAFTVKQIIEARRAKPDECRPEASLPSFAVPVPAGDPVPADVAPSLLGFVQRFYDWYVPLMLDGQTGAAWDVTLRSRRASFDSTLLRALIEDREASARDSNDVVGLDFDPFLASQDPCSAYKVGAASKHGDRYWVEVFAVCDEKQGAKPALIAQVTRGRDSWTFVNFRYPDGDDLVATLMQLKADRASDKH